MRLDTEQGQAVFRTRAVAMAASMCLAAFALGWVTRGPFVCGAFAYLLLAMGWQRWVERQPDGSRERRFAALAMDQTMIALLVWLGGPDCLLFLWTGPLASIGHGVRFGEKAGHASAALGGSALALAMLTSAEWRAQPILATGIVLMAVIMPIYVVLLASRLAHARDGAEARAHELERQTRIDPLTGLLNRSGLQAVLQDWRRHDPDRPLALAFVDLDGFKAVNDELGHAEGDLVLCQVADRLRRAVGPSDHVIRLGGDEFAVVHSGDLLPHTLDSLGQRLCQAVRRAHPRQRADLQVRASVGIWSGHASEDLHTMLMRADELMYQSKRRGPDGFVRGGLDLEAIEPQRAVA